MSNKYFKKIIIIMLVSIGVCLFCFISISINLYGSFLSIKATEPLFLICYLCSGLIILIPMFFWKNDYF